MKEGYFFQSTKDDLEKKQESELPQPISVDKHQEAEEPMSIKDHWLSFRHSIQELSEPKIESSLDNQGLEQVKRLSELISPELMADYKQITNTFNEKSRKTKTHPERKFIDLEDKELSILIDQWIERLILDIKNNQKNSSTLEPELHFNNNDFEELRAQYYLFFESLTGVINSNSLEKDIKDFYADKSLEARKKTKYKKQLIKELQDRYPLEQTEIDILVDIVNSEGQDEYSLKILIDTISRLWRDYNLGDKKGDITKMSLGYLLSQATSSFAPSLFQNVMVDDKFRAEIFLAYFALNQGAEIIDTKMEIELHKVIKDLNLQINQRIVNSLFFQEFEFIHEKSLGEIFMALERGKNASSRMLGLTISRFVPALAGISMSLGFLTKINPILGAIGLGSLPVLYKLAKKQNEQIWPMYEQEKREGEKISTKLGSIKSGFEQVKTSSEIEDIAEHVKGQMDTRDELYLKRVIEEAKNRIKRMIPFNVSSLISLATGAALQEQGLISGGAVFANILYANQLNRPVQELVYLYFNEFSRLVQDIQRMDDIFGQYEKLDLPEGEKEASRLGVSVLDNFNISINNLNYKNILNNLNLEIKQGEFLSIAGASGAGKSTLIRNLVGLYKPNSGEIKIGGVSSDQIKKYGPESIYSLMSYCNQSPQIFEGMTLRENLLLWSRSEFNDDKIKEILSDLNLGQFNDRLDEELKHLSGGEKVRIGLARTLIKGAKIMLLDEPTASLDSRSSFEVRRIIKDINEKYPDVTIICVSHDEELLKMGERSIDISEIQTKKN